MLHRTPMDVRAWAWLGFAGLVATLLVVDIAAHWRSGAISKRSAALWSTFWIGAGVAFGAGVWLVFGRDAAFEYIAAYAIEKSLSLDNLFLFLVVFSTLGIRQEHQRRALYFGIVGALVLRGLFVWLGVEVLRQLAWVNWIFGAILLASAIHAAREHPGEHKRESKLAAWFARHLPVATRQHDHQLIAHENGRRVVTPLFVSIVVIEVADIAFAIDSVPAALSITQEPFLVYSSNVFAILGLRSLYALLAATIADLAYLHWGIAAVLGFAAVKIAFAGWFHVPPLLSVAIVGACIGAATVFSLIARRRARASDGPEGSTSPRAHAR